eukprot:186974-Prorocentrum_minimum.AAC.7
MAPPEAIRGTPYQSTVKAGGILPEADRARHGHMSSVKMPKNCVRVEPKGVEAKVKCASGYCAGFPAAPKSTFGQPCGSLSAGNIRRIFDGIFEMLCVEWYTSVDSQRLLN